MENSQNASYQAGQVKGQTQVSFYVSYLYLLTRCTLTFLNVDYNVLFLYGLGKGKQHDGQG
jgi:hypothetical protein